MVLMSIEFISLFAIIMINIISSSFACRFICCQKIPAENSAIPFIQQNNENVISMQVLQQGELQTYYFNSVGTSMNTAVAEEDPRAYSKI